MPEPEVPLFRPWCDRQIASWPWHKRPATALRLYQTPEDHLRTLAAFDRSSVVRFENPQNAYRVRACIAIGSVSKTAHEAAAQFGNIDHILLALVEDYRLAIINEATAQGGQGLPFLRSHFPSQIS